MKKIPVVTCMLVCCLFLVNARGEDGQKGSGSGRSIGTGEAHQHTDGATRSKTGGQGRLCGNGRCG